jgi:hypothetical protein
MNYSDIPSSEVINTTIQALQNNGMEAEVVNTGVEARERALSLIPKGGEVFTMTSVTLDTIKLPDVINESGNYDSVRKKLSDQSLDTRTKRKLGAAPDFTIGSAHAVSQDGKVFIASNTGSQLPAYVYGAGIVIWVVGVQKIVADQEAAFKRIYEYVLPLESERAHKAYGVPGSNVSKLLVVNKEVSPGRLKIIFVKEVLGF